MRAFNPLSVALAVCLWLAAAARSSSSSSSSSSLEAILKSAGRAFPEQRPAAAAAARSSTDLFAVGSWLADSFSAASHQLAMAGLGLGLPDAQRRLRPQGEAAAAASLLLGSQAPVAAAPWLPAAAAAAPVGSTVQQQRQQPQQERELAAAAAAAAQALQQPPVYVQPRARQTLFNISAALKSIQKTSSQTRLKDVDRAALSHLTAAAAKAAADVEVTKP
ncbi:hypothetical protein, conserved [Eimeria tenella]|uniref:Uncharacterized protein n=1 Tax=Eimeria tenella TaxID=5802 RepID=U6L1D7_EIMTE|nr:hypothetical protein, conserved [Eimeria tenella]CDJ43981.1 hypothetical protein, conserved [Eimeria tenella]|eukprot:XP_013234730.1 hypothetical protein, conserved [Eimeria tenella]